MVMTAKKKVSIRERKICCSDKHKIALEGDG